MFNHEKTRCGSTSEVINEHDTAMGLVKLGFYAPSDYTLYEIVEEIPDAYDLYLSGWSSLPAAPSSRPRNQEPSEIPMSPWRTRRSRLNSDEDAPTEEHPPTEDLPIVGIHHPSGDSKKISFFYNGSLPKTCWSECEPDGYDHWKIPRWDEGTTEPGSSGSPLFDADKRIVGQLHGGAASCYMKDGYDAYGGLFASFQTPPKIKDRLATYLDPESTGTKVMDGYSLKVAKRESANRQRRRPVDSEVFIGRKPAGPLGHPSLEKPSFLPDHHHPRHQTLSPAMFERLSATISNVWEHMVQDSLEEQDD